MAQISFDALVARQEQREADRLTVCQIKIPGTDDHLLCRKPTEDKMLDFYGKFQAAQDAQDVILIVDEALYHCCEQLQDGKLREAIGVKDPLDVVPALFSIAERDVMGGDLLRFLGLLPPKAGTDEADEPSTPENPAKN